MKTCQKCGNENTDAMSYCLQCGAALGSPDAARVQVNIEDTVALSGTQTTPGVNETQTFVRNFASPTTPQVQVAEKKGGRTLLIVLGVGGLVFLTLLAGAGGLGYYYYKRNANVAITTPSPTRSPGGPSTSPSGSPGASPSPTASVAPSPQPSFTPPTEPTKTGTFTVYGNGGWQISEIDTVPLENFRTTVAGLVDLNDIKTSVNSKGLTDPKTKSRRLYQEFPTGALLMRTRYADGKYSNVQPVTAGASSGSWQNFPDERGRLEFCINDNAAGQNGGQFTVTIKMTSAPKPKN
jgi:hypothetical protein